MKVLFIGGNGNISWWCVEEAIRCGHEVYELNRGRTRATRRALQPQVDEIIADILDEGAVRKALEDRRFDVVCDFICFNREQAEQRIKIFTGMCKQYIVISSEAVYCRESVYLPFRESTPQYDDSVADAYIAGKVQVERTFRGSFNKDAFPVTIVRPGYTYDTIVQMPVGQNCFTAPKKLMAGYPFLMPGDGENLVAPLHSRDFARAFVGLIGKQEAVGEDYHIAAEKVITWNEMARAILLALGLNQNNIIHIPYKEAMEITDFYSRVVNQQHMWHYIFDDTKIKKVVPGWCQKTGFSDGISETIQWLLADPVRQRINPAYDEKLEAIYARYWNRGKRL